MAIGAPPKDNEANEELLNFLCDIFDVKKSSLSLEKGGKSRNKLVCLDNIKYNQEDIYNIIKEQMK